MIADHASHLQYHRVPQLQVLLPNPGVGEVRARLPPMAEGVE